MKKLISLLLALAVVMSLCACGGGKDSAQSAEPAAPTQEAAPSPEEEAAEALGMYYSGSYAKLFEKLTALEDSGSALVQELLGLCHYYGLGTDADADTGAELLMPLAESSPLAAYIIAEATRSGDGAPQDPEKAKELYAAFILSAANFDTNASLAGSVYTALAQCYYKGMGCEQDGEKAMAAVGKALPLSSLSVFDKTELAAMLSSTAQGTRDNIDAQLSEHGLGIIDLDDDAKCAGVKERDEMRGKLQLADEQLRQAEKLYTEALNDIRTLADDGNLAALKLLGDYSMKALGGVSQDYEKAMEHYMLAADEDYAPAQAQIALMYQDGLGVDVNYEQAMEWNNRAAQQGNAQGQAQIGYLYHMGLGVTQNLDEAGRWYSRAADQGDTWAAAKLVQTEITNPQLAFEFHA